MNNLKLRENETLEYDVDDLMEKTIFEFHDKIKDIPEEERVQFRQWIKIYKTLNYDIFNELKVLSVFRFNKHSAVIKIDYKGKVEYDFLLLDVDTMTVRVISLKEDKIKKNVVRRMLVPQTAEEALMYAKSEISKELIDETFMLFNKIQTEADKHDVTKKLHEYLNIEYVEPEVKEEPKEEPKTEEYSSEKSYEEEVKEETKSESIFSKFAGKFGKKNKKKESTLIDLEKDNDAEIQEKLAKLVKEQEEMFNVIFEKAFKQNLR